jgi:hypothetical protein
MPRVSRPRLHRTLRGVAGRQNLSRLAEETARLTVLENENVDPVIVRWRPWSDDIHSDAVHDHAVLAPMASIGDAAPLRSRHTINPAATFRLKV